MPTNKTLTKELLTAWKVLVLENVLKPTFEGWHNFWCPSTFHCGPESPIELEFRSVGFCGGRKTGEKPSEQGREPTTNSTHIWRRVRESSPGHIGGRRALSPLRYPCSPSLCQMIRRNWFLSSDVKFCTLNQNIIFLESSSFWVRQEKKFLYANAWEQYWKV